jgi:hypothetical protein
MWRLKSWVPKYDSRSSAASPHHVGALHKDLWGYLVAISLTLGAEPAFQYLFQQFIAIGGLTST